MSQNQLETIAYISIFVLPIIVWFICSTISTISRFFIRPQNFTRPFGRFVRRFIGRFLFETGIRPTVTFQHANTATIARPYTLKERLSYGYGNIGCAGDIAYPIETKTVLAKYKKDAKKLKKKDNKTNHNSNKNPRANYRWKQIA